MSPQTSRGTGQNTTRSASAAKDRSCSTLMEKPILERTTPGRGATMRKSKFGTPSADRSRPNASQATPNSNGAKPSCTTHATVFITSPGMAVFLRTVPGPPLVAASHRA